MRRHLLLKLKRRLWMPVAALGLLFPVAVTQAQTAGVTGAQGGAAMQLRIVILDGDNALNNIRQRTAREPVIQIEDENHKPVAGAAIVFLVRGGSTGANGSFAGSQTFTTTTDALGHATGLGFTPNTVAGNFTIAVTATLGMVTASTIIHQANVYGAAVVQRYGNSTRHARIFTRNFWVTTGVAAASAGTVAAIVVLTNSKGATITAGQGGVTRP